MKMIKFPKKLLEPVRRYLLGEKKRLKKITKDLAKEDPYNDPRRVDDNAAVDTDVAEQADHDRVSAIRMETTRQLINIRKALSRIKLGRYGICINCGNMIDTDRLAIKPTAEYCMKCLREEESKKRR